MRTINKRLRGGPQLFLAAGLVLLLAIGAVAFAQRTGSAASVEPEIVAGTPSCSHIRPDLLEAISVPGASPDKEEA